MYPSLGLTPTAIVTSKMSTNETISMFSVLFFVSESVLNSAVNKQGATSVRCQIRTALSGRLAVSCRCVKKTTCDASSMTSDCGSSYD